MYEGGHGDGKDEYSKGNREVDVVRKKKKLDHSRNGRSTPTANARKKDDPGGIAKGFQEKLDRKIQTNSA